MVLGMSKWTTQQGEEVGIGDRVALDLLKDKDAVVRLEAASATGAILCVIVESSFPTAIGKYYLAMEEQLLMLVHRNYDRTSTPL